MKQTIAILCAFILFSCKEITLQQELPVQKEHIVQLKYAKGFSVEDYNGSKVLNILKPWPNSEKITSYILVKEDLVPILKESDHFDYVIPSSLQKIVTTSTTHIPALELLEVENRLIGFPGCDYISSEKTRERIENGEVRELGKNEGINTEVLLELDPDLIITFGVDGTNKSMETIERAGVPVIYNGDWVESSPLAKAEWIKFFGVLFNKEKEADSIFSLIEKDYLEAKNSAKEITNRPTILSGAMYKDVWYLPSGSSPEAQFLKDANVDYLWSEPTSNGSLSLSFEGVFEKGQNADIWLSPSYYKSLKDMEDANAHYKEFKAFKDGKVFSFSNTTGATGGVLYYELGIARPDLVLKDIIKTCHPQLLPNYTPYFFKQLK